MIDDEWESCQPLENGFQDPVCINFDLHPDEKPGALVLDAIHKVIPLYSSEDKRLEQMASLLGIALVAKGIAMAVLLYNSSRTTVFSKSKTN